MSTATPVAELSVRQPSITQFQHRHDDAISALSARGQNFLIDWFEANVLGSVDRSSDEEAILVLPAEGCELFQAGIRTTIPTRSVSVLPKGTYRLELPQGGRAILIRSDFTVDEASRSLNAAEYQVPNPRVVPSVRLSRRPTAALPKILSIDDVAPASGRSRLKMLQSETLSINWVEYVGPRDRTQLSPHSHDDFEQGSLAIEGAFVHHLRVPWGSNAELWREDVHMDAPAPNLAIFPPGLIHTTEGTGSGHHLLLDIFCPARQDFREKGWIHNAGDYVG